jgi:hypothetical protein
MRRTPAILRRTIPRTGIVDAMFDESKATARCLAVDATGASVRGARKSKCDLWHVFVFVAAEQHIVFRYSRTHDSIVRAKMLDGYRGYLLADASSIYAPLVTAGMVILACCWAHYLEFAVIRSAIRFDGNCRANAARRSGFRRQHLQRVEESKQLGLGLPAGARVANQSRPLPKRVAYVALHSEIARHVTARRRDARVSEVVADDGDIHAGLEQCDRAAMAKDVGADARSAESGMLGSRARGVLSKQVRDAVSRQLAAASTSKHGGTVVVGRRQEARERRRGVRPQRAYPVFAALTVQSNLGRASKLEISAPNADGLADARALVVEERQERVVPCAGHARAIGLREDRRDDLGLPVIGGARPCLLRAYRENSSVLRRTSDVVSKQVLNEAADCRESAVAGRWAVVARRFNVVEKGQHRVGGDVVEREARDRSTAPLGDKQKEEAKCEAVRANSVATRAADATEMVGEICLKEAEERGLGCAPHWPLLLRASSCAKRRPAVAINSGVAVSTTAGDSRAGDRGG